MFEKRGGHTLSAFEYDYHRDSGMPKSETILMKTDMSWDDILASLDIPTGLSRNVLARLSQSLHLLEKILIDTMGLGWVEQSFHLKGSHKTIRPDSCCVERMYLQNERILILDVKLSIYSGILAIYKYLPIFRGEVETVRLTDQLTFFPEWLPETAVGDDFSARSASGQVDMFLENHVLYICYLTGDPIEDLLPGSRIASSFNQKSSVRESQRLPENTEVRFIEFRNLPELYSQLGGIDYDDSLKKEVEPILKIAEIIRGIAVDAPKDAETQSELLYKALKSYGDVPVNPLWENLRG